MAIDKIKSGFVSIVGLPNAGKSTFLNAVLNDNIAITSRKPQTTRKNLKGIYNDDNSQIVFVDTPGIHNVRNQLDEYMSVSIKKSFDDIDLVVVIIDGVSYNEDNYDSLNKMLFASKSKKILVVNKCDIIGFDGNISKKNVNYDKFVNDIKFEKIFYVSSLKKKGIKEVIEYIKYMLPEGKKFYDDEYITDEPMKQIVADMIRQQCLYKLDKEIPHGIAIVVEKMKKTKNDYINIDAIIICEKDSHKGIIIGKGGLMIKNIGTGARIAIEKFVNCKVNLKLNVVVKNNWREEKTLVANYGYDIKQL